MSTHRTGDARYLSGTVVERLATGGGYDGQGPAYAIRGEDGQTYRCDYTDVVTEGFRTLSVGNVVRFSATADLLGLRASNVLKLDDPTVDELYGGWATAEGDSEQ